MTIKLTKLHHVCLVVRDQDTSIEFYTGLLGLRPHATVESWLHLVDGVTLHLVEIPEAKVDDSLYHEVQHFAVEVAELEAVLRVLIAGGQSPFQMDFNGNERKVTSNDDPLDFGIGTLFVRDPDGNLIEFVDSAKGIVRE